MTWNFFSIVDASDDDPRLYPVLSGPADALPVGLEPLDGSATSRYAATAAVVLGTDANNSLTKIVTLPDDLKWEVLLTASRLIVYCEKFDRGGGWRGFSPGGLAVAAAANAVSKARAASRRRGKVLVAHVRYPWIERVLATPKADWRTTPRIRVRVNAAPSGQGRYVILELTMAKQHESLTVANELVHRAAHYRLTHDASMEDAERRNFESLLSAPIRQPAEPTSAKQPTWATWATYPMPTSYRVNVATAYPPASTQQAGSAVTQPPP